MKKSLAQKAASALAMLGDTPEEIAANLKGAGFRGVQKSPESCPCGTCLREHFGDPEIRVYGDYVYADRETYSNKNQVIEFVKNFDRGRYRSLIERIGNAPTTP